MTTKALIKHLQTSKTIDVAEGREALGLLSEYAALKVSAGLKNITEAGIALYTIHEHKLWQYGDFKTFEAFMTDWSDHNALGRSTGWYIVSAVSLWVSTGHDPDELLTYSGGVNVLRPLLEDRDNKIVRERDKETGEVLELANEWKEILAERYPTDEEPTPHDLITFWLNDPENLGPESTGRSVRSMLSDQRQGRPPGSKVDKIKFWLVLQYINGEKVPVDISWSFSGADGSKADGKSMRSMLKKPHVLRHFMNLLGMQGSPGG